ncbi:MAG: hypothetical protein IID32_10820 [Planctomycetes bacterium]|nr:hypothetical protein [Planctomycetota bacterium]
MQDLYKLVGKEHPLVKVSQALQFFATSMNPSVVGAIQITCADETEFECIEAFQQGFVRFQLPRLKFNLQRPFHLTNLGGRYEWGAVRVAEQHYAVQRSSDKPKLLVVKINAHVGLEVTDSTYCFGKIKRYGQESTCCSALSELLHHAPDPFTVQLKEDFHSEGIDRLESLGDEKIIDPGHRALFAAIVSVRLQGRKVILDIQDYTPVTNTTYLVLSCVTINRIDRVDTELVCGCYRAVNAGKQQEVRYYGLGDNPADYKIDYKDRGLSVSDSPLASDRPARNHRQMIREQYERKSGGKSIPVKDERLVKIGHEFARNKSHKKLNRSLLKALLLILSEVSPVPAAVLLFAHGAAGIHHTFTVHRLAKEFEGSQQAREILSEIHGQVDQLDPDEAEALIELLMEEYGGG